MLVIFRHFNVVVKLYIQIHPLINNSFNRLVETDCLVPTSLDGKFQSSSDLIIHIPSFSLFLLWNFGFVFLMAWQTHHCFHDYPDDLYGRETTCVSPV